MNRDSQVRLLIPFVMQQKGLTREQAKMWILGWPPEYRRNLFRWRAIKRGIMRKATV